MSHPEFHRLVEALKAASYIALAICYYAEASHGVFATSYLIAGTVLVAYALTPWTTGSR